MFAVRLGAYQFLLVAKVRIASELWSRGEEFKLGKSPNNIYLNSFSDLQNVDITLRILFRPEEKELPKIFKQYGTNYDDQILPSITTEVLKAVVVGLQSQII